MTEPKLHATHFSLSAFTPPPQGSAAPPGLRTAAKGTEFVPSSGSSAPSQPRCHGPAGSKLPSRYVHINAAFVSCLAPGVRAQGSVCWIA